MSTVKCFSAFTEFVELTVDRLFALLEQEYKWAARYYMPVYSKAIHWANKLLKCSYLDGHTCKMTWDADFHLEFLGFLAFGALPGSLLLSLFPTSLSTPGEFCWHVFFILNLPSWSWGRKSSEGGGECPGQRPQSWVLSIASHCISTDHLCSEGCALGTWLSSSFCDNLEKIMPRILFCCVVDFFFFHAIEFWLKYSVIFCDKMQVRMLK